MSKGAGNQTTTTKVDPQTQAIQQEIFNRARQVSNQTYQPFTGQTVAPANPYNTVGLQGMLGSQNQFNSLYGQNLGLGGTLQNTGSNLIGQGQRIATEGQNMMNGVAGNYEGDAQRLAGMGDQFNQLAGGADAFGQRFNPYMQSGLTGAQALGGDQSAISKLMNPYQQGVIDQVSNQYDRLRDQAHMDSNEAATRAGAFGGSRQAIMEGQRLGELDRGEASTIAGLQQQGFNDMINRAGSAANLGFGAGQMDLSGRQLGNADRGLALQANQVGQGYGQLGMDARQLGLGYGNLGLGTQNLGLNAYGQAGGMLGQAGQAAAGGLGAAGNVFNAGDYFRQISQQGINNAMQQYADKQNWDARNLDILRSGFVGPQGSTQSTPLYRNVASGVLGGAATGFGIGGPIGAGIGGLLGLFG